MDVETVLIELRTEIAKATPAQQKLLREAAHLLITMRSDMVRMRKTYRMLGLRLQALGREVESRG
jgi:hypothetical protein